MYRYLVIYLLLLLPSFVSAQVISNWDDNNGIINTWNDQAEPVHGFDETLEEFSETPDTLKCNPSEIDIPVIGARTITINGKKVQVPTMFVDGIDFFMLMPEGISIMMAASPTAYYEEPDNDTIKWIRYYAFSKRQSTARLFKKFSEWEKFISLTMLAEGVPEDIGLMCLIESGCSYTAVSNVGATGMWQFMPETAREMGLEVSELRDQRKDPIESTKAAARYLKSLYKSLGSWTLAIASYNCGIGRTENLVKRYKTKDWAELKHSFPIETQQYIPALQAIHYVWTYRSEFGL